MKEQGGQMSGENNTRPHPTISPAAADTRPRGHVATASDK